MGGHCSGGSVIANIQIYQFLTVQQKSKEAQLVGCMVVQLFNSVKKADILKPLQYGPFKVRNLVLKIQTIPPPKKSEKSIKETSKSHTRKINTKTQKNIIFFLFLIFFYLRQKGDTWQVTCFIIPKKNYFELYVLIYFIP